MLRIDERADLTVASYDANSALSQQGEVLRVYRSLGIARALRKRNKAT